MTEKCLIKCKVEENSLLGKTKMQRQRGVQSLNIIKALANKKIINQQRKPRYIKSQESTEKALKSRLKMHKKTINAQEH